MKTVGELLKILCLISPLFLLSCNVAKDKRDVKNISYPEPLPDSIALVFLPGIVSSDSIDFGSAFSPDAKSFYFSRKKNNRSQLYVSQHNGNTWTDPAPVSFADDRYAEADPAFSPDGKLYFISTRPKNESDTVMDYDIWFVTPLHDGRWSDPTNAENINSDSAEYYISFTENDNLYFASSRAGGYGEEDLYVSKWVDGNYGAPDNLGSAVNTGFSEYDPFISPKGDFIIFTSSHRDDSFGSGDLYCATIDSNLKWGEAHNLGKEINTPTREYCPYLTPDGDYFFFSSAGNIKWVRSTVLKEKLK
ncbi:PD40 domain-containing protein [Chryseolinea lacunae]|uniref:PD40 domain-containing protein n=1 Tax=Chryseolinea lacunae TaxID=2801331 RepID=A0ABS1KZS4_9BACT|nr:PD40 domain-containing protein [Chryseolinea lacunae]MBL0744673.1 PD40 domain-containing protein [Chryseolinea lacunae]